jgi:hypothetical protein
MLRLRFEVDYGWRAAFVFGAVGGGGDFGGFEALANWAREHVQARRLSREGVSSFKTRHSNIIVRY